MHQKLYFEYQNEGFYKITIMHTGKSLTVKNNDIRKGAQIIQYEYQGLDSQKWILRDSGKGGWILSPASNLALAINIQGTITNGSKLTLSNTQENYNQLFCLYNISDKERMKENGIYKVAASKDIGKSIEVPGGNQGNNAQLGIWNFGNGMHQKAYFEYQNEGFYKITLMHTGKSLTVKDNKIKDSSQIVQYDYQGLNSQKWLIRDTGKGGWVIAPLANPMLTTSIENTVENGSKLILSETKENYNQLFCLYNISSQERQREDGIYKIVASKDLGKSIEVPGGNRNNNVQLGIWDYRKWRTTKMLF